MRLVNVALAVGLVLTLPQASESQQVSEHSTPSDVRKFLGPPRDVRIDGNRTTWRYGGANPREIVFVDGRASGTGTTSTAPTSSPRDEPVVCVRQNDNQYHLPNCPSLKGQGFRFLKLSDVDSKYAPHAECNAPQRPNSAKDSNAAASALPPASTYKEAHGLAIYHARNNRPEAAFEYAAACLTMKPGDKGCLAIQRDTKIKVVALLHQKLRAVAPTDVHLRRTLAFQGTRIDPSDSVFTAAVNAASTDMNRVIEGTRSYVLDLHAGRTTPLPAELAVYADTMPEVALGVSEYAFHSAIADIDVTLARRDFAEALQRLNQFSGHPEYEQILDRGRKAAHADFESRWLQARSGGSLAALDQFISDLSRFQTSIAEDQAIKTRDEALTIAAQVLKSGVTRTQSLDSASARILAIGLSHTAPALSAAIGSRFSEIVGIDPGVDIAYSVNVTVAECPVLTNLALLQNTQPALTSPLRIGQASKLAFSVQSVRCAVETIPLPPEPLTSKYVASYQQDQNPRYVQLQSELQQAQVRLTQLKIQNALNPAANVWAALANGIAEGACPGQRQQSSGSARGDPTLRRSAGRTGIYGV